MADSRPVCALDVSYGDALAAPGLHRVTDDGGNGVDVNAANGVATFVWYGNMKSAEGTTVRCGGCGDVPWTDCRPPPITATAASE